MTWLLVSTRPELLMTIPLASAFPPGYWGLPEMSTTPGSTALATARALALLTPVPELGALPLLNGLPWPLLPEFGFTPGFGDPCDTGVEPWFSTAATIPAPTP